MAKQEFKAESKRLLDLMINSIYTHKEIFIRELISNASDAIDKLAYKALTDDQVGLNRSDFKIVLVPDKETRTLTISDNGIGMTKEDLENNLGTIAQSGSLKFKEKMAKAESNAEAIDIIGQFGVGFYSAFMVADHVTVRTKAYGSDQAWEWESDGTDGYTIEPCDKAEVGTDVILHMKDNTEDDDYGDYLLTYRIQDLVSKYSDYIHIPVRMEVEKTREKEKPADAGEDYKAEYETYKEWTTLNSMVPLWQRPKNEIKQEEYFQFYKQKFGDWEDPLAVIHVAVEGQLEYKALLFIPSHAPMDYYSKDYKTGLQLYTNGVLIMDQCEDVVPAHFNFIRGIVDTSDLPLNISRETLQHTRALQIIQSNVERKVKAELLKMMKDDKEKYLKFWDGFSRQLKYGVMSDYGTHQEVIRDLLLYPSSHSDELTTLKEYQERMKEGQDKIFYLSAESVSMAKQLPQAERVLDKGYEILYFTDQADEFAVPVLSQTGDKPFVDAAAPDAIPETDEEKEAAEKKEEANKPVLDFVKEVLGDKVHAVRISKVLKTAPVCLNTEGPVSIEMEKYFQKMQMDDSPMAKAQRILELNADSPVYGVLAQAVAQDQEKAKKYVEILYDQALIIAGLPVEDTARYTELVTSLFS